MKIELVAEGAPECPLIRIYDYDDIQLIAFKRSLDALIDRGKSLSDPYFSKLDMINIEAVSIDIGRYLGAKTREGTLYWTGEKGYWCEVSALIAEMMPMSLLRNRFQWLSGSMAYHESAGMSVLLTESDRGHW